MNDETTFQQKKNIIWDTDGSPDSITALLYFLQHPRICVDALTVSCGEAHPDIFVENLARIMVRLGRELIPIAVGSTIPLKGSNTFPEP